MKQRAGAMFQMLAAMKIMDTVDVTAELKNLYFDLAGDPMPEQMEILLKITDVDHLLYGSDYPYVPAQIWLNKKRCWILNLKTSVGRKKFIPKMPNICWRELDEENSVCRNQQQC